MEIEIFMKHILGNRKGVTILEGLIALGLLAMVAVGTFGVLLSSSRKASNPDEREEMILAVERIYHGMQMFSYTTDTDASSLGKPTSLVFPDDEANSSFWQQIRLKDDASDPLCVTGKKTCPSTLNDLLPVICNQNSGTSQVTLSALTNYNDMKEDFFSADPDNGKQLSDMIEAYGEQGVFPTTHRGGLSVRKIQIVCNRPNSMYQGTF